MAIDTRNKRMAMISYDLQLGRPLPDPDGTFDAADRQQLIGKYPGIAFNPPSAGGSNNNLPRVGAGS